MVSNEENIFQKTQKHNNNNKKKGVGKVRGISSKLGVPVECRLAPSLTESHSPCLVFLGTFWVLFYSVLHSKKKIGCAIKFLKNFRGLSNWGI